MTGKADVEPVANEPVDVCVSKGQSAPAAPVVRGKTVKVTNDSDGNAGRVDDAAESGCGATTAGVMAVVGGNVWIPGPTESVVEDGGSSVTTSEPDSDSDSVVVGKLLSGSVIVIVVVVSAVVRGIAEIVEANVGLEKLSTLLVLLVLPFSTVQGINLGRACLACRPCPAGGVMRGVAGSKRV
jgi:hypothetical protein